MHVICLLISAPLEVSGKYLSSVGGTKFCICASRCAWGELCVWGVSLLELWLKCKLCSVFLVCLVVNLKDLHASDLSLSLSVSPPPPILPLSLSLSLSFLSSPSLFLSSLSLPLSSSFLSPLALPPLSLSLFPLSLSSFPCRLLWICPLSPLHTEPKMMLCCVSGHPVHQRGGREGPGCRVSPHCGASTDHDALEPRRRRTRYNISLALLWQAG